MEAIDLPIDVLRAAVLFTIKEDIRFYLTGVALNEGHIVATDGHRMFWCPWQMPKGLNVILPRDAILEVIAKWKKIPMKQRPAYVQLIETSASQGVINIVGGGASVIFTFIDAKYPEWRRVTKPSPTASNPRSSSEIFFNWDYLADAKKASALIHGKNPVLVQDTPSTGGHIIFNSNAYPDAKAIIQPMNLVALNQD